MDNIELPPALIRDGLEFHNVSELEPVAGGFLLQRFPAGVRRHEGTNELGRLVMTKAAGAEIRFVTPAKRVRVSFSALEEPSLVYVFRGDFFHREHMIPAGGTACFLLERPAALDYFKDERYENCRFSPGMWRVWCGRECTVFGGLDTFGAWVRPPESGEKPGLRWLAYGSSYTMGGNAIFQPGCYAEQAARILGVDVLNLGLGGSCHLEPHVMDHIASRNDWDFATLRVGGNMVGEIDPEEYRRRLEYALSTLHARRPGKPVFIIGLSTSQIRLHREIKIWQEHAIAYHDIDSELAARHPEVVLLRTGDLLPDHRLYCTDMDHPDDLGHLQIATNLAAAIRRSGRLPGLIGI